MINRKQQQLLTLQQAAKLLQCHPNTLRNWDEEGILPAIRFGKRGDRKYRKEDLKKFMKNGNGLVDEDKETQSEVEKTLRIIYEAGLRLMIPDTIEDTYKVICDEALALVQGDYFSIYLFQDHKLSKVYTSLEVLKKVKPSPKGHTYKSFFEKKVYVLDVSKVLIKHPILKELEIQSTVFIPLSYEGLSIGVLSIDSCNKAHFNQKILEILKLFGSMAALKIMNMQLNSQLREAIKTRDLFISMAAHELKTPLTSIHGYAQLIQKKIQKKSMPSQEWVTMLVQETTRSTHLIDELLHIEQIKTKKLRFNMRECDLKYIVQRAVNNFFTIYPTYSIQIKDNIRQKEAPVVCDIDKILQVLMNIFNNAAKFSDSEVKIVVVISRQDGQYRIEIQDDGKGIPEHKLQHIFQLFYKGEDREGLGLGLYLSKVIIDHHKGTIAVTSTVGKGTKVVIQLPINHEFQRN